MRQPRPTKSLPDQMPKKALLFGATRGVGLALCRRLHQEGVEVVALVRPGVEREAPAQRGVVWVEGDARNPADVRRAFEAFGPGGLVLSTLGGRRPGDEGVDDEGNIHVIEAALAWRPDRFVLITSLGCGEMEPHVSERARAAFGAALVAKTRAEDRLRATDLPYSILRPGGLRDGPATGRGFLTADPEVHGFIHREDVALLTLRAAGDPGTLGLALAALDADLVRCAHAPIVHPLSPCGLWGVPAPDEPRP